MSTRRDYSSFQVTPLRVCRSCGSLYRDAKYCGECESKERTYPVTLPGQVTLPSDPPSTVQKEMEMIHDNGPSARELLKDPDWEPRLYTNCYHHWKPEHGLPVQTSVGNPKYWRGPVMNQIRRLTPFGLLGEISKEVYESRYIARLEKAGVPALRERFRQLSAAHGGKPLVFLCYEDLSKSGKWCHRSMFARWWTEQTGVEVVELGKKSTQLADRLF